MVINLNRMSSIVRQLASVASVVIGSLGTGGLPPNVRAVLVAGGALIMAVEHLVSGVTATSSTKGSATNG